VLEPYRGVGLAVVADSRLRRDALVSPTNCEHVLMKTQAHDRDLKALLEGQPRRTSAARPPVAPGDDHAEPELGIIERVNCGELVGHNLPHHVLVIADPYTVGIHQIDSHELGVEADDDGILIRGHRGHRGVLPEAGSAARSACY